MFETIFLKMSQVISVNKIKRFLRVNILPYIYTVCITFCKLAHNSSKNREVCYKKLSSIQTLPHYFTGRNSKRQAMH